MFNKKDDKNSISKYTQRGFSNVEVKKYRPGACENCGAITHKKKDCFERPRAKGAKYTNKDIRRDEYMIEAKLDYEGKHDTWNGYDPNTQLKKIYEYQLLEEAKLKEKLKKIEESNDNDLLEKKDNDKEYSSFEDDKSSDNDLEFDVKEIVDSSRFSNALTRPLSKSHNVIDDYKKYMNNLNTNKDNPSAYDLKEEDLDAKKISTDEQKFLDAEKFEAEANKRNKELNVSLYIKLNS